MASARTRKRKQQRLAAKHRPAPKPVPAWLVALQREMLENVRHQLVMFERLRQPGPLTVSGTSLICPITINDRRRIQ